MILNNEYLFLIKIYLFILNQNTVFKPVNNILALKLFVLKFWLQVVIFKV